MVDDTDILLEKADQGNLEAFESLLERYRSPLRRMVQAHFDPRLISRVDPSDVVQETFISAYKNLPSYLAKRPSHFFIWLRSIAKSRLLDLHRRHVRAQGRSIKAEQTQCDLSDHSVDFLAKFIRGNVATPSEYFAQAEEIQNVRTAFNCLDEHDREVLTMRYLERIPVRDAAKMLGISGNAFTKQHLRALQRLRSHLRDMEMGHGP